jgi:hypothetical protein
MCAPAFLAAESPMAMAFLRLVTFLPERPLRSSPRFISCIARFTLRLAVFLVHANNKARRAIQYPMCHPS